MMIERQTTGRQPDSPLFAGEEERWQAVQARDRRGDGRFVFAVQSTGIYCRPSCPARRPRRSGVRFFATPGAAESAGFRACRRCQPDRAVPDDVALVRRVCRYIEEQPDGPLGLQDLAAQVGYSPWHLHRLFKREVGMTPHAYVQARRVERFKGALRTRNGVAHAGYDAGYGSSSGPYKDAWEVLGMTPATYRKGGRGMTVRWTVVACALGWLLVAATERGICAVQLGDSGAALEENLHREFPAATVVRDDGGLRPWAETLAAAVAGQGEASDGLPLDIKTTAFQARVYALLRAIPRGSTLSYSQIAAALGQRTAARAVGRACATNPVALVVPCHRAVGTDGGLHGYRWGLQRKRALLEAERAAAAADASVREAGRVPASAGAR